MNAGRNIAWQCGRSDVDVNLIASLLGFMNLGEVVVVNGMDDVGLSRDTEDAGSITALDASVDHRGETEVKMRAAYRSLSDSSRSLQGM